MSTSPVLAPAASFTNVQGSSISTKSTALVSRWADFWLLGGASLVLWLVYFVLEPLRPTYWTINFHIENSAKFFLTALLFVNYPHFMASYKLAYGQGKGFILSHWFALIVVPVLLVSGFLISYFAFDQEVYGQRILAWMLISMYFLVGWHYVKQIYGCMMVYAHIDGYQLPQLHKNLLKYSLMPLWFLSFVRGQLGEGTHTFQGLTYNSLNFPAWTETAAYILLALGIFSALFVFFKKYQDHKVLPSINMLVPWISIYIWWVPLFYQNEYTNYAVIFFHSLQYLPFIYKIENTRMNHASEHQITDTNTYKTWLVLGLIVAGYCAFELLPNILDVGLNTYAAYQCWFFFVCGHVFINVHHYFIDHVIWRFKEPEVRDLLLKN